MITKTIQLYENRDDVTMTTYLLDDSPELRGGLKRGAMLICPGGAYLYNSDREGEPVALAFAALGYQTFVLRCSVYNENRGENVMENILPNPDIPWEDKPEVRYPGPMRDLGMAMKCIYDHADEWQIDRDNIGICGFSAGAHNCAMYAVNYNKPVITDYLGIRSEGIRPATVILGYMLSDYRALINYKSDDPVTQAIFEGCIHAYYGKEKITELKDAELLSPALLVNDTTPPMFLWATAQDNLVDPEQTLQMAMALNRNKIPYEVHLFEEGKHGMVLANEATASSPIEVNDAVAEWMQLIKPWLRKHLPIKVPVSGTGF